jgi:tripeptide aminopeptidase
MGIDNAHLDEQSFVTAHIAANNKKKTPSIGFIAHVDTSPDVSGAGIKAQIFDNYNGEDIVLNPEKNIRLLVSDFPEIIQYKGQTLITTDGTTLLGADDKAGIAAIMQTVDHIMKHPEIEHGDIHIAFTPDEEIGHGVDGFDVKAFGANYAYTVDGGQIGELEYENFNAAVANLTVQGCNMHPGYTSDKFKNALLLLESFNELLPSKERPETTRNHEGFYFLAQIQGTADKATAKYLIRDHSYEHFNYRKTFMKENANVLNKIHGEGTFFIEFIDQYYNMREEIEKHMHIIDKAVKAMEMAGIKPVIQPIRGGTDGARLSFMGLPCPNLFAGGHNFHSIYEYVPVQSMEKSVEVLLNLIKLYNE